MEKPESRVCSEQSRLSIKQLRVRMSDCQTDGREYSIHEYSEFTHQKPPDSEKTNLIN